MARVCQLTDDLKYYLCMEPVDMRGKMFDMFMPAFIALGDKESSKGQELLQKYQLAAKKAHESLADEIKDKLVKVEAKSKSKTEQIASLVRMIFTQKRERILTLQLNFEICNTVLSGYTG